MRNSPDHRVRNALWRLSAVHTSDGVADMSPLVFLKTPAITCLWLGTLVTVAGILLLGRIQVPRVARGSAVAVRSEKGDTTLLLLLPASARAYVHTGQRAELDAGSASPIVLDIAAIDTALLDATTARHRFSRTPSLIAQLDVPKLVVRLSACGPRGCLTPIVGETYAVTTIGGTRSLASYALSGS